MAMKHEYLHEILLAHQSIFNLRKSKINKRKLIILLLLFDCLNIKKFMKENTHTLYGCIVHTRVNLDNLIF